MKSCTAWPCSTPWYGRAKVKKQKLSVEETSQGNVMEKLIITVAADSRTSYPHNDLCPPQEDIAACAQQYVDAAKAGAAISHIHGRRTLETEFAADGKMVSKI